MSSEKRENETVVTANPLFDEESLDDEVMPSTMRKKSIMKRVLMVTGTLALAGGAFAAGYFVPNDSSNALGKTLGSSIASTLVSGRDNRGSPIYSRRRVIRAIEFLAQNDETVMASPALADAGLLTQAVAVYKLTGQVLFGLTEDFLSLMAQVSPDVPQWLVDAILAASAGGGERRLGATVSEEQLIELTPPKFDLNSYGNLLDNLKTDRNLQASGTLDFINRLYIFVATDVRNMAHTVDYTHDNTAQDHFGIQLEGEDCYIAARETDEDADWVNNGKGGIIDILTINSKRCGLSGITAFAEAYNEMRLDLWNVIETECKAKGATKYNFGGWSRGGALSAIAAAALYREGLLDKDEVRLMTFGAPRALQKWDARMIDGRFEAWRLVYKDDIVPALPASWNDVGHYGTLVSKQGSYPLGRDEPFFVYAEPTFADHAGYFLDWLPSATWDPSKDDQAI